MSELTQQQTVSPQQPEEQEIDLIELAQKVWARLVALLSLWLW